MFLRQSAEVGFFCFFALSFQSPTLVPKFAKVAEVCPRVPLGGDLFLALH